MKTCIILFGLAGLLMFGAPLARAELEVGAAVQIRTRTDFYTPLSPCGTWVEVGSYGRCWRPTGVVVGWRPYCEGYWVWTDCGWYWVSDEPWAWACYHYGWWVYDGFYGWVWVPDIYWAPCWVSWRVSAYYIGWAPLPPRGHFFARQPADAAFVFVANEHFNGRISSSVVIPDSRDIFKQTKYISNIQRVNRDVDGKGARKVMINEGPGLAAVQKATGKPIQTIAINEAILRTPEPAQSGLLGKPKTPNAVKPDAQKPALAPGQQPVPPDKNSPAPPEKKEGPLPDKRPDQDLQPAGPPPGNPGQNQGNKRRLGRGFGGF